MGNFDPATAILKFLGFLIALTMHEAGIAIMAKYRGDRSPETASRATLNPVPHIDILGTIVFPLLLLLSNVPFLIGWAKRFQVSTHYFRNVKKEINYIYTAGVATNFVIALICAIVLRILLGMDIIDPTISPFASGLKPGIDGGQIAYLFLFTIGISNMVIGTLNLFPVPGFDGWYLLLNNVSYTVARKIESYGTAIMIALLVLMLFGALRGVFHFLVTLFALAAGL